MPVQESLMCGESWLAKRAVLMAGHLWVSSTLLVGFSVWGDFLLLLFLLVCLTHAHSPVYQHLASPKIVDDKCPHWNVIRDVSQISNNSLGC